MDRAPDESGGDASAAGPASTSDTAGLFHTSEIRWFAHGPLPPEVTDWFTGGRTAGSVESRVDTYQLFGLNDIGVKRRRRETLEVKVRRAFGASLKLGDGLEGRIEEWSRWEPGEDGGIWQSPDRGWVAVRKVI